MFIEIDLPLAYHCLYRVSSFYSFPIIHVVRPFSEARGNSAFSMSMVCYFMVFVAALGLVYVNF